MAQRIYKYTLPDYWASYLINGDASGLSDQEEKEIDTFIKKHKIRCVDVSDESSFAWRNDANNLGGDVSVFSFVKWQRPAKTTKPRKVRKSTKKTK